ncbi:hypothetical protein BU25DRAFT_414008 [Macroventuria anomochaeta]|uniref:Uncharacterized protein n=1 Tax=Macroventuria anomochaeta TaxID=301207 RepID=A0ACB6RRS9_9PLEO|nr:uncharacterized protein BU25DRAFT_414008 [Macroventuria anomochaeta]KAF2623843.1 hypothetical protein BU25DRAFT_414008 [Macroventuria anomochaeta]
MGILHMSEDGVLRSLTADRTVISAQGLTPEQIQAFQERVPEDCRTVHDIVDGSKTDKSTWFEPAEGALAPPQPQEHLKTR